jgi:hypothetical protein
MAVRVYFERPATAGEVDREAARLQHSIAEHGPADAALRRLARARLERLSRLKSNLVVWLLAMTVLTPVNVLIEWQDSGGFQRVSRNSQPGSWDPWILFAVVFGPASSSSSSRCRCTSTDGRRELKRAEG